MPNPNDADYGNAPIDQLKAGIRLRSPIYDVDSHVLLISAGQRLTREHIASLTRRGITHVRVGKSDLSQSPPAEGPQGEKPKKSRWSNGKPPFMEVRSKHNLAPMKQHLAAEFTDSFASSIFQATDIYKALAFGDSICGSGITAMLDTCLSQMLEDFDLFASMRLGQDTNVYPISHAVQTTRLAMAIGAVMCADKESLTDLGTGCLLHDIGMLRLAPDLLNSQQSLHQLERLSIKKHPTYTFDMIKDIARISGAARMVAYQMHERLDGSGYPRNISRERIHPLSKIAMIADTYVALTSPRPHRGPIPHYYAVLELLEETSAGRFDQEAMEGFLDAVSLFPLGSSVELNTGDVGNVLRANPGQHTKPVVEVWSPDSPDQTTIVDLTQSDDLKIVRPLLGA